MIHETRSGTLNIIHAGMATKSPLAVVTKLQKIPPANGCQTGSLFGTEWILNALI